MDCNTETNDTMTDELFQIPETLSPRLRWMREHDIRIHRDSEEPHEFTAWTLPDVSGYGATEDEALADLARKLNVKLWNE
jgi:hypothetical protein